LPLSQFLKPHTHKLYILMDKLWTSPLFQFFKPHTHKLYILRHCTDIVYTDPSKCINAHTLRSDISLPKCPIHSKEISDKFESRHPIVVQFFDYEVLLCIERLLWPSVTNIDLWATFPGANTIWLYSTFKFYDYMEIKIVDV
jgi:hypothetical protein